MLLVISFLLLINTPFSFSGSCVQKRSVPSSCFVYAGCKDEFLITSNIPLDTYQGAAVKLVCYETATSYREWLNSWPFPGAPCALTEGSSLRKHPKQVKPTVNLPTPQALVGAFFGGTVNGSKIDFVEEDVHYPSTYPSVTLSPTLEPITTISPKIFADGEHLRLGTDFFDSKYVLDYEKKACSEGLRAAASFSNARPHNLFPELVFNTDCLQLIHANIYVPYFCTLPKKCGKVLYKDASAATFLGNKLILCYSNLTFLVETKNITAYDVEFVKPIQYCVPDFYGFLHRGVKLLYSDLGYAVYPDSCLSADLHVLYNQDFFIQFENGNLLFNFKTTSKKLEFCPLLMWYQTFEEAIKNSYLLFHWVHHDLNMPKRLDVFCETPACDIDGDNIGHYFLLDAKTIVYFSSFHDFKYEGMDVRRCERNFDLLPEATLKIFPVSPDEQFVTFFDVLKIFLFNILMDLLEFSYFYFKEIFTYILIPLLGYLVLEILFETLFILLIFYIIHKKFVYALILTIILVLIKYLIKLA